MTAGSSARSRAVKAAAAAALCGAAAAGVLVSGGGRAGPRELLAPRGVQFAGGGGQQQLARALHGEALTVSPDVAEWIYNNENGNQDGQFGPDGGWVPWEEEPCPTGICHNFYTARGRRAGGRHWERLQGLQQVAGGVASKGRAGWGGSAAGGARAGRLQALGEVSDFPDIDEYVPTKDAQAQVDDIYDAFQPVEDQLQKISPAERCVCVGLAHCACMHVHIALSPSLSPSPSPPPSLALPLPLSLSLSLSRSRSRSLSHTQQLAYDAHPLHPTPLPKPTKCTMHTHCPLHPIAETLYPIPYTLYPIPHTLYPIPYTL